MNQFLHVLQQLTEVQIWQIISGFSIFCLIGSEFGRGYWKGQCKSSESCDCSGWQEEAEWWRDREERREQSAE